MRGEKSIEKKKMGRPTTEPKTLNTRIRLSENDIKMLDFCVEKTGYKKSDIIRLGIKTVYDMLKNENS